MTTFLLAAKTSAILISLVAALGGCSSKSDSTADSTAMAPAGAMDTSGAVSTAGSMQMSGMANMTGDPDRDFLRMMSDHHKGLIAIVHPTLDKKENFAVKGDARKMDKAQDAEIEKMITILDQQYNDTYTPSVMPDKQRMVDELKGKSGADYSRTFLKDVIAHHEQAIKMIDHYLPKAKNAHDDRGGADDDEDGTEHCVFQH